MGSVANTAIKSLLAKVTLKTSRMPKAGSHSTAVSAPEVPDVSLAPPSVSSRASCEAVSFVGLLGVVSEWTQEQQVKRIFHTSAMNCSLPAVNQSP